MEELGRSVLKDLGHQEAKTDHPTEQGAQASRPRVAAGAVRFGGFGPLSGQKTVYQREKGAQKHSHRRKEDAKQKNSWASPL